MDPESLNEMLKGLNKIINSPEIKTPKEEYLFKSIRLLTEELLKAQHEIESLEMTKFPLG